MAITIVGTVQTGSAIDGTNVTLTFDGSPQEGDLVVVVGGNADQDQAGPVGPFTAGYTQQKLIRTSTKHAHGVWTKPMGSTPDSSVVCQGSGVATEAAGYVAMVLRGANIVAPMDAVIVTTGPGTSDNPNFSAITTSSDGALVILAGGIDNPIGGGVTSPTGYSTVALATGSDSLSFTAFVAYKTVATAGSEDPGAWTLSAGGRTWLGYTVAIAPTAQPVAVALTSAAATLSAQALGVVRSAAEIALAPATLTLTAQTLTVVTPVIIEMVDAVMTASAQVLGVVRGGYFTAPTYEQPIDNPLGRHGVAFLVGKIVYICTNNDAWETTLIMGDLTKQKCPDGHGLAAGSGEAGYALFRRGNPYPVDTGEEAILVAAGYTVTR